MADHHDHRMRISEPTQALKLDNSSRYPGTRVPGVGIPTRVRVPGPQVNSDSHWQLAAGSVKIEDGGLTVTVLRCDRAVTRTPKVPRQVAPLSQSPRPGAGSVKPEALVRTQGPSESRLESQVSLLPVPLSVAGQCC
eukprot:1975369-Rhodomonas_salina.4